MAEHTQTPWRVSESGFAVIAGSDDPNAGYPHGRWVARIDFEIDNEVRRANARRIVACVNFCAGINTETLEVGPDLEEILGWGSAHADLLAACKAVAQALDQGNVKDPSDPNYINALKVVADRKIAEDLVRVAIAKAEGK